MAENEHVKETVITLVDDAVDVFCRWLRECDIDNFCAAFDATFGTWSMYNPETEEITITPSEFYGNILKEFE